MIEFLHGSPFFVVPQQEPGPRWGIQQTKNGFQDSIVDIVSGAKAENDSDGCCTEQSLQRSNDSFICHRRGRIYRHRQLTWKFSLETVNTSQNAFSCSMHRYTADQWPVRRNVVFQITVAYINCKRGCTLRPCVGGIAGSRCRQRSQQDYELPLDRSKWV